MGIEVVGVVGVGVMGRGLAQDLAQHGLRVIAVDVSDEILGEAKCEIERNIRCLSLFKKGPRQAPPAGGVDLIEFSTDYGRLAEAEFVIENVTEKWEIKKEVFSRLDSICTENCIFSSDTSAIPITRIASVTGRPDKVIGLHFMNPVPMKSTVEMIAGDETSDDTIRAAKALLSGIGKEWIIVRDSPGFISNRVLMLTINEAICLVAERVATAEDVDRLFQSCFSHPMGPLATCDLIGLDTVLLSLEVLHDSFKDAKYKPCPLLRTMVDEGLYGRKAGQGFYSYQGGASPPRERTQ